MRQTRSSFGRAFTISGALFALVGSASAADLSTSATSPTPLGPGGLVEGSFPEGKTSYYISVDVKPGDLLTQIGFDGRPGARKAVVLALIDGSGRSTDSYWTHGEESAEEKTRAFPIDASGKQILRLEVEGPPTARFRVEVGGSALANASPKAPPASTFSRSIFTPTPVASDGIIAGSLPGSDKRAIYYLALPVKPGDLLTQISVQSREGASKSLSLELLGSDARSGESYWVHGSAQSEEKTRAFPIDASGTQLVRLIVEGPEAGTFKVEVGGSAAVLQQAEAGATIIARPAS
ncbi:MAG: hypothetical protein FJ144_18075 [Deltaproteobacteria bacterium]|nr:hypothetical protein [Deltaproteobacteria bacterium]